MPISVGNQYRLSLTVDGEDYSFDHSLFQSAMIFESVAEQVPTLQLNLIDDTYFTDVKPIHDGAVIGISVESILPTNQRDIFAEFRVFGHRIISKPSGGDLLRIVGYLDVPAFWKDAFFIGIDATSSDAFRELANRFNFKIDVDASNDKQIWLPAGLPAAHFADRIARAAYKDSQSVYVWALTLDKELIFANLNDREKQEPKYNLLKMETISPDMPLQSNDLFFEDGKVESPAGILNKWAGYGSYASFTEFKTKTPKEVVIAQIDKATDYLQINRDLANPSRYEALPVDCGNFHPNFQKAVIQNRQNRAAYSYNYRLVMQFIRDLKLLNRFRLSVPNKNTAQVRDSVNGEYFLDRKTTIIDGDKLTLGLNLVRKGLNSRESIPGLL